MRADYATTTQRGLGSAHQKRRAWWEPLVADGQVRCARCRLPILPGQPWDLGHVDGTGRQVESGPEHRHSRDCPEGGNRATAGRRPRRAPAAEPEIVEREGLEAGDERWRVPWLQELLAVPEDATWPRLMTVPHPRAVDSLGPSFIEWAEGREGRPLRWWQRLTATRLLEVDTEGRLLWRAMVLSTSRQVGKSWLLRELILWRMHQGDRFGEPQDVLHTGKDLAVCKEVQRPARAWAKRRGDEFRVRLANGDEQIEKLDDGSRWMLRAQDSTYGYAVSFGVIDEAWRVRSRVANEGLAPTMVERVQPQLLLVSTAHRLATGLMLSRRQVALDNLEVGDGDLMLEWSAPPDAELDDVAGWRAASPHWTLQREQLIRERLDAARGGAIEDPDEPDPEKGFVSQWMNQWPHAVATGGTTEELLPAGSWAELVEPGVVSNGDVFVAVEDGFGNGAGVAAAARLPDGRIEVDGETFTDWDQALEWVRRLGQHRRIRVLLVGASMLDRVPPGTTPTPAPAGGRETRLGLPLLRDLVAGGLIVHDTSTLSLDDAVAAARVRETPEGLRPVKTNGVHLVKALVWAVVAAHKPAPVPAIV